MLNVNTATEIIKSMRPIIDYDLNIMNHTGLILASTDTDRVNTYHEGAHIIIEKNLNEFIVEKDNLYHGCKRGVNLPIHFATEIIGVIGITGNPTEVIKYGRILQTMTEMLIRDYFDATIQSSTERELLIFVNNLVYGNTVIPLTDLEKWMQDKSIEPKGPFTVALLKSEDLKVASHSSVLVQANFNLVKNYIKYYLNGHQTIVVYSSDHFILISNKTSSNLNTILLKLCDELKSSYDVGLSCYIGNDYSNYLDIPKSFREANTIFHYYDNKGPGIFLYNTIVLNFTIEQIPIIHRRYLYDKVFSNCTPEEIEIFKNFILQYFESNGSLIQIAKSLFIHKNTVQYRILSLYKKTGFDIRNFHDLFVLYLAVQS